MLSGISFSIYNLILFKMHWLYMIENILNIFVIDALKYTTHIQCITIERILNVLFHRFRKKIKHKIDLLSQRTLLHLLHHIILYLPRYLIRHIRLLKRLRTQITHFLLLRTLLIKPLHHNRHLPQQYSRQHLPNNMNERRIDGE